VVIAAMELCMHRASIAAFLLGLAVIAASARAEEALSLEGKIALPGVAGRIDHMAVDLGRKRLLVAALGNGTLDIVDLAAGRRIKQIAGLREPQGVGYAQKADLVAVASAGDGSVRFFRGEDLAPAGSLALGNDADNVRLDPRTGDVIVGYGSGGLAIINPEKKSKIGDIKLAAHPESFQLDPASGRIFVNVPDAGLIAVVDLAAARQVASWTVPGLRANFPLAADGSGTMIAAVFRHPAKLVLLDPKTGAATQQLDTCGDADDVFFDTKRRRIYVSCGAGAVDAFQADAAGYRPLARIETSSGARTSLFVPELDRLYIAARAGLVGSDAAILVFRPVP
jgi:hypothetical protein